MARGEASVATTPPSLDPRFVEAFVRVLAGRDLRFRHGDDADFDAELALERRAYDYATGAAEAL